MEQRTFGEKDLAAIFIGFGLVVVVAVFFSVRYFSSDATTVAPKADEESIMNVPTISFQDALQKYLSGNSSTIVDIRSAEAFQVAHIPDSLSLPAGKLSSYSFADNPDLIIVADDLSGDTTHQADTILKGKHLRYAFLSGGLDFWAGQGAPVVTIGNPASYLDQSKVTRISEEDWKKTLTPEDGLAPPYILDVRRKDLFDKNHIADAHNIPIAELEKRRKEIPAASAISLYGETDLEAFQAAVRLFDLGFFAIKTLEIGYSDLGTTK